MSKHETIKQRILSGTSNANLHFDDLCNLLKSLGFQERIRGSHRIYSKQSIADIINLQPARDGKAKPYQVSQVRRIIRQNNL